jgi:membrane fusion protein (multidrug efflux system)
MSDQPSSKKPVIKKIILVVLLIVGLFFGYRKINYSLTHETTDNAQVETQIVPVITRTSGYVKSLMIGDYDSVKAGQFLIELDDAELQAQLAEAKADSAQTQADISNAKASLQNALVSLNTFKGIVAINTVKLNQSQSEYNRNKNLMTDGAITSKQMEDSKFALESAQKLVDNAKNDLLSAESKIPVLEALVNKSQAELQVKQSKIEQLMLKIGYAKIYAPVSGKIGKKNITIGQFVQMGTPLFSIVNDSSYWVTANFKENQIKSLFVGKTVDLRIDAFPHEKITGTIQSISDATGAKFALLPPDNSSGNFVLHQQHRHLKYLHFDEGGPLQSLRSYRRMLSDVNSFLFLLRQVCQISLEDFATLNVFIICRLYKYNIFKLYIHLPHINC